LVAQSPFGSIVTANLRPPERRFFTVYGHLAKMAGTGKAVYSYSSSSSLTEALSHERQHRAGPARRVLQTPENAKGAPQAASGE
jgi:hypothetical protein